MSLRDRVQSSSPQYPGAQTAPARKKILRTWCDRAVHPITRLALAHAFKFQPLEMEPCADQLVEINAFRDGVPPDRRRRESTDAELLADVVEDFDRKERDLAFVVFAVIEEAVPSNSSSRDAFNFLNFKDRTRAGFRPMVSEEVVSRRNEEMADRYLSAKRSGRVVTGQLEDLGQYSLRTG